MDVIYRLGDIFKNLTFLRQNRYLYLTRPQEDAARRRKTTGDPLMIQCYQKKLIDWLKLASIILVHYDNSYHSYLTLIHEKEPRILLRRRLLLDLCIGNSSWTLCPSIQKMSSATGIPAQNPATSGRGEDEPLLGRAGDASQQEGKGIQFNLFIGGCSLIHAARSPRIGEHTRAIIVRDTG